MQSTGGNSYPKGKKTTKKIRRRGLQDVGGGSFGTSLHRPPPSSFPVKCQWLLRIITLVLNMIRLHIYHITEVYCPNDSFPVVPLISCLGENFIISTENI